MAEEVGGIDWIKINYLEVAGEKFSPGSKLPFDSIHLANVYINFTIHRELPEDAVVYGFNIYADIEVYDEKGNKREDMSGTSTISIKETVKNTWEKTFTKPLDYYIRVKKGYKFSIRLHFYDGIKGKEVSSDKAWFYVVGSGKGFIKLKIDVDVPSTVYKGEEFEVKANVNLYELENLQFPIAIYVCLYRKDNNKAKLVSSKYVQFDEYGTKTVKFKTKIYESSEMAVVPSTEFDGETWDNDIMCRDEYTLEVQELTSSPP